MAWGIFLSELILLWLTSRYVFQGLYEMLVKLGFGRANSIKLLAFIFLPGTIVHELAHMMMAESLRVRTGHFTIFPREEGDQLKLGSVRVERTDPVRSFFIGIAPLLVGVLVILALFISIDQVRSWQLGFWYLVGIFLGGGYIIFVTANTMFSSRKDIEACVEFIVLLMVFGVITYFLWNEHIPRIIQFFLNERILESLSKANVIFAVPLAANLLLIIPRLFLRRR